MQGSLKGKLLVFILWLGTLPALAAPCPGIPVVIDAPPVPVDSLCDASADALAFLARYDLKPRRPILISLVETPLQTLGHPVYGSYDSHTDRVRVMSYAAIRVLLQAPKMYEEPFDAEHYRGVIAHEVAHAVVQHNTALESISRTAHEYLAHATQLAVLPEPRRRRIIALADVGPWEPGDILSDTYMAFAPDRFAVKCYLHLSGHKAPRHFVRTLLKQRRHYVTLH